MDSPNHAQRSILINREKVVESIDRFCVQLFFLHILTHYHTNVYEDKFPFFSMNVNGIRSCVYLLKVRMGKIEWTNEKNSDSFGIEIQSGG